MDYIVGRQVEQNVNEHEQRDVSVVHNLSFGDAMLRVSFNRSSFAILLSKNLNRLAGFVNCVTLPDTAAEPAAGRSSKRAIRVFARKSATFAILSRVKAYGS